jgi:hypothetical protein
MKAISFLAAIAALGPLLSTSATVVIHVSPTGKDSNTGSLEQPVATLAKARDLLRDSGRLGKEPAVIRLADGIYYLPETFVLEATDSGNSAAPITYEAVNEGKAIISGGFEAMLKWEPWKDGIFKAAIPAAIVDKLGSTGMDQVYVNGQRQRMARFPNAIQGKTVFDRWDLTHEDVRSSGEAEDPLAPERVSRWSNPAGAYLHLMHPALWGDVHYRAIGKKSDGTLDLEGGWQNNRPTPLANLHKRYRFVENVFEELDAAGEWFYQANEKTLYYMPAKGLDLASAKIEFVRLRHLVELRGSRSLPVNFVTFRGLTFRHAARTFMDNKEPLLRSDWTVYRGGAVMLTGTEDCAIMDSAFDQVGGNTVFVNAYNRRVTIRGCLIRESGANGVAFVGDPAAVRSPLFNYGQPFDYSKIDRTPGPKTDDYPADCLVEDCLVTRTGRDEKQTAPIQISMAQSITVSHCSIYEAPRAGINIGDGCWGGHIIEHCDVFETVLETGDHGSFNSWGRDRYWHPDTKVVNREVAADPALPFLDVVKPVILRNNRWRCDHGWDIDLDDGSSRFIIENNLLLHGGLKLREGYQRTAVNNVIVNNSFHPHVWFAGSGDVFTRNIVMGPYRPAIMPSGNVKWGEKVDGNLFTTSEKDRERFAANDCDVHSVVANALFINPAAGDFQVQDSSEALKLGFKNFSMDQFGVRKASLKSMARTPKLPVVEIKAMNTRSAGSAKSTFIWKGATLKDLTGEEFSAYGIAKGDGGIAFLEVSVDSEAARDGWRTGDVILKVGEARTPTMPEFIQALQAPTPSGQPVIVTLARGQQLETITLTAPVVLPTLKP